jgi:hypothetical protein
MVTFSATPVNGGTAPFYQWKVNGAEVTGVNTADYSYVPADADEITCSLVSNAVCVTNNPAASNAVYMQVISVPAVNAIQNMNITGNNCFNAIQTITVAGEGTTFTVENGGSATMIAGQNIIYLPGTIVKPGGYMIGYITTNGQYCGYQAPSIATVATGVEPDVIRQEKPLFQVYPNPTEGDFVLQLTGSDTYEKLQVEIYSMTGKQLLVKNLTAGRKHDLSLTDKPAGLYLIKVVSGSDSGTTRIIKR